MAKTIDIKAKWWCNGMIFMARTAVRNTDHFNPPKGTITMKRIKMLVVLSTMMAGCSSFTDSDSQAPMPSMPVPTPQSNPCTEVNLNGSNDGGISRECACYQESASLPCYEPNSCGQVVGNGYCHVNNICVMKPPFGRLPAYYCKCLLTCEGRACGEDNGCGIKCDAPCANGLECKMDTVGGMGCRDPKKCAGLPCGAVDDQGYSCNGFCDAASNCVGFDVPVYPAPLFKEGWALVYKCQCTPSCSNKPCNASDGCGGTCIDACPPDPCIALRRDVDLKISILDDGSWAGTATNTNKETVACEFMGDTIIFTRVLAPNQTVSDLSWPKGTYSVFDVCFLSSGAAACFAEF